RSDVRPTLRTPCIPPASDGSRDLVSYSSHRLRRRLLRRRPLRRFSRPSPALFRPYRLLGLLSAPLEEVRDAGVPEALAASAGMVVSPVVAQSLQRLVPLDVVLAVVLEHLGVLSNAFFFAPVDPHSAPLALAIHVIGVSAVPAGTRLSSAQRRRGASLASPT